MMVNFPVVYMWNSVKRIPQEDTLDDAAYTRSGSFKKSMGARNRGGIGLSYGPVNVNVNVLFAWIGPTRSPE
jgi:hypothetical protein